MQRSSILALTGLRFIAAACVVLSHALPQILPVAGPLPLWLMYLEQLSGIGMTLFFVLSGFVIHYNYADKLAERPAAGTYKFFVARLARLYPLYVAAMAYDWGHVWSYSQMPDYVSQAAPYYLTMTQAWTYQVLGEHNLVYMPGVIAPLTWSISTEWFFYCVYPLICLAFYRMRGLQSVARYLVGFILVAAAVVMAQGALGNEINAWAVYQYGPVADIKNPSDSFLRWMNYLSPYAQIPNFILGCFMAELHNRLRDRPVPPREQILGLLLTVGSILSLLAIFITSYIPELRSSMWVMNDSCSLAPSTALLIFCCARYTNHVVKALRARWMLFCGEASYSIYLLHFPVLMAFRWEAAKITDLRVALGNGLALSLALACVIGAAYISYRLIEVPGRTLLTRLLSFRAGRMAMPLPGSVSD